MDRGAPIGRHRIREALPIVDAEPICSLEGRNACFADTQDMGIDTPLDGLSTPVSPGPKASPASFSESQVMLRDASNDSGVDARVADDNEEDMTFEEDPDGAMPFQEAEYTPEGKGSDKKGEGEGEGGASEDQRVRAVRICSRVRVLDSIKQMAIASPSGKRSEQIKHIYKRGPSSRNDIYDDGDEEPSSNGARFPWRRDSNQGSGGSGGSVERDAPPKIGKKKSGSFFLARVRTPARKTKGAPSSGSATDSFVRSRSGSDVAGGRERAGVKQQQQQHSNSIVSDKSISDNPPSPYGRRVDEIANLRAMAKRGSIA